MGFIVVAIDGRGTPHRGKAFLDHGYADMSKTNDLNDRIAGLRQLAERYPYMDLDRVGITNIDMETNAVYALLDHPDFYKVAVEHLFHEQGAKGLAMELFYDAPDGVTSGTEAEAVSRPKVRFAKDDVTSLKGKLLLIDGMLSAGTISETFQLVDALYKANKDFDLLLLPNLDHNLSEYSIRRGWDYLITHLQHIEPPKEFDFKMPAMQSLSEIR